MPTHNRSLTTALSTALAAGVALTAGAVAGAVAGPTAPAAAAPEATAEPPTITPADIRFSHDVLRTGSPRQVGLLAEPIARMPADAASYLVPTADHPTYPTYAGAEYRTAVPTAACWTITPSLAASTTAPAYVG